MDILEHLTPTDFENYHKKLSNRIFCILPLYEESGMTESLLSKIDSVKKSVNGYLYLVEAEAIDQIKIMSYLTLIEHSDTHDEIKSCVFKSLSLFNKCKGGVR